MTCLGRLDRRFVHVHWLGVLESRVPDEAERMVLFSAALAESWCFWGLFS